MGAPARALRHLERAEKRTARPIPATAGILWRYFRHQYGKPHVAQAVLRTGTRFSASGAHCRAERRRQLLGGGEERRCSTFFIGRGTPATWQRPGARGRPRFRGPVPRTAGGGKASGGMASSGSWLLLSAPAFSSCFRRRAGSSRPACDPAGGPVRETVFLGRECQAEFSFQGPRWNLGPRFHRSPLGLI